MHYGVNISKWNTIGSISHSKLNWLMALNTASEQRTSPVNCLLIWSWPNPSVVAVTLFTHVIRSTHSCNEMLQWYFQFPIFIFSRYEINLSHTMAMWYIKVSKQTDGKTCFTLVKSNKLYWPTKAWLLELLICDRINFSSRCSNQKFPDGMQYLIQFYRKITALWL